MSSAIDDSGAARIFARHMRFGWWMLLVFLTMGIGLEALHAFKAGFYLDVSQHTRRLMWTLAHAHGVLLGLVHIAFALTTRVLGTAAAQFSSLASACLIAASVAMPGGFFLGGLFFWEGDPGLGVLLVPVGGLLLLIAVGSIARSVHEAMGR